MDLRRSLRVLVVDDHSLVREGTRTILERDPRIEVVGEAPDGDVRQVALLAITTNGFPTAIAALGWIDEVLAAR